MSYIFEGDSEDAKRNRLSVIGSCGPAYNAVIERPKFSGEATTEPVSLDEAKAWLAIDLTENDTLITALIKAARLICERYANQSFITRTVSAKIHNGLGNFNLPYGPVVAVSSIKDGDTVLSNYDVSMPYQNDIVVVYTAGYTALPEDLKTDIKNQVGWMYQNRGDAALASGLSLLSKLHLDQIRND